MPYVKIMAGWQSGYAAACKAVNSGSIPDSASIFYYMMYFVNYNVKENLIFS